MHTFSLVLQCRVPVVKQKKKKQNWKSETCHLDNAWNDRAQNIYRERRTRFISLVKLPTASFVKLLKVLLSMSADLNHSARLHHISNEFPLFLMLL